MGGRGRRAWNSVGQFVTMRCGECQACGPNVSSWINWSYQQLACSATSPDGRQNQPPSTFFYARANLAVEEASMSISRSVSIDPGAAGQHGAAVRNSRGERGPRCSVRVIVIRSGQAGSPVREQGSLSSPIACELAQARSRPCGTSSFVARSGTRLSNCTLRIAAAHKDASATSGSWPGDALFTRGIRQAQGGSGASMKRSYRLCVTRAGARSTQSNYPRQRGPRRTCAGNPIPIGCRTLSATGS